MNFLKASDRRATPQPQLFQARAAHCRGAQGSHFAIETRCVGNPNAGAIHRVPVELVGMESEGVALADLPLAAEHHRAVNLNLRAQAQAPAKGRGEADNQWEVKVV